MKLALLLLAAACGGLSGQPPRPLTADYLTPKDRVMYESSVRLAITCPGGGEQSGSGFAISPRHVITAAHVITCGSLNAPISIVALLRTGVVVDMEVDAVDRGADAARLRPALLKRPFAYFSEVRLTPLKVGEYICSIGGDNPNVFGVKKCGFVTVVGVCQYDYCDSWMPSSKLPHWFHSSIPVVPGNSGSAVFDARGRVVGIVNTWWGSYNREQGGGHFGVFSWWKLLPIKEMRWSVL